ncbi:MAG: LamG-like jellyroll fold domain-containing protein [Acidobacteriota bacterium]
MRRGLVIAALVASGGCDSILRLDPIKPVPQQVAYRKPITITNRGAMLADEPVSITTVHDLDLVAHAQADGSDLAFDDGTNPLPYELVAYDAGTLDAWVRVPALPMGATTIYLTYGGAAATRDPTAAWPDAYVGVWHQSGSDATSTDTTSHRHDLAAQGTGVPAPAAGIAGDAREFADQQMCGADNDGSLEFVDTDSFTYSLWVNLDGVGSQFNISFCKGGTNAMTAGYELQMPNGSWTAEISDGANTVRAFPAQSQQLNQWIQVVIEVDRAGRELRGYRDGSAVTATAIPMAYGSLAGDAPMCLGGEPNGNYPIQGRIDEARVMRGLLSVDQIVFEHANLAARDSVIAIGPEEPVVASP